MAGLDKIKSQLLDEAKVTADAKIVVAKALVVLLLLILSRLLEAMQEMIAKKIEKAYEKVINLAPDDYYQMLLSILEAYILPQEGEIYFSVKDLENMPVGFG